MELTEALVNDSNEDIIEITFSGMKMNGVK